MAQIASEYGVHPAHLSQWKKTALENLASVFVDDRKVGKQQKATVHKLNPCLLHNSLLRVQ